MRYGIGGDRVGKIREAVVVEAYIVSRLGSRFDQASSFQVVVGLECSAHADTVLIAEHTNRGKFVADLEYFFSDHFFESFGHLYI